MTGRLEIVQPGPMAMVQDLGRSGLAALGIPRSGMVDRFKGRLVNRLAGNPDGAALIEFRVRGPQLRAVGGAVRLALGADVGGTVSRASAGGTETTDLAPWRTWTLAEGDLLSPAILKADAVGYLAVAGGIGGGRYFGSAATYARAGFGKPLAAGTRLMVETVTPGGPERMLPAPPVTARGPIRVVLGPQDDHFTAAALDRFSAAAYRVTAQADRMGVRLDGPKLAHKAAKGADIISDGLVPGAIQVPGNGLPIILFVDAQTIGGYAKIATVIAADLDRVGQLKPGDALRFAAVSLDQARRLYGARQDDFDRLVQSAKPCLQDGGVDLAALYSENLIGGMVDALSPDRPEE